MRWCHALMLALDPVLVEGLYPGGHHSTPLKPTATSAPTVTRMILGNPVFCCRILGANIRASAKRLEELLTR